MAMTSTLHHPGWSVSCNACGECIATDDVAATTGWTNAHDCLAAAWQATHTDNGPRRDVDQCDPDESGLTLGPRGGATAVAMAAASLVARA